MVCLLVFMQGRRSAGTPVVLLKHDIDKLERRKLFATIMESSSNMSGEENNNDNPSGISPLLNMNSCLRFDLRFELKGKN